MKFTCIRSDFSNAVSKVKSATSTKSSLPVLEGILIKAYNNKLTICGYDLEIGMITEIDATIQKEGEIVISAARLDEIIRKLPEEIVSFETDERLITYISSGKTDYKIPGISSTDYPEMPSFDELEKITVNAKVLKSMIKQTIYAVSTNFAKPIYTGSLFEFEKNIFRIIAIDGFRMALREENIDSDIESKFVVPGKAQNEIIKLITDEEKNVEIIIGQRHINFKVENFSIISRLIEGTFIDYKSTIPKTTQTEFVINTRSFYSSVDRVAVLNEKIQSPVRCNITSDEIKFSCTTSLGNVKDEIPANVIGQDVEIGFNSSYMLDALRNTDTDEVKFILNGGLSPIIIKPVKSDSFTFLVVPMRLSAK